MRPEHGSLALRPHGEDGLRATARTAASAARLAHASAGRRPHVDAIAVDAMAIGGRVPSHRDVEPVETVFDTHWTRSLHHDLFAVPDARAAQRHAFDSSLKETKVATIFPNETFATGSLVTPRAMPAAHHGSADNDPTCQEMRGPVLVPGVRHWPAGNGATRDAVSAHAREIERRARNALATMRVAYAMPDDAGVAPIATTRRRAPTSVAQRARDAFDALAAFVRSTRARRRRRLQARAICQTLRACDDRTLRDLGLHRSEITSLAAEATGMAACTRERIHRLRRGPR
jgi:uncharacterized protein YjiS (DUF1127 family)